MTGWRIGMAVGNPDLVEGLAQAKSNLDSGIFQAIQEAGIAALKLGDKIVEPSRKIYQERRDILVDGLRAVGLGMRKAARDLLCLGFYAQGPFVCRIYRQIARRSRCGYDSG